MTETIRNIESHKGWHTGLTRIQPVSSHLSELFTCLEEKKFLLLYGPPNSGKETFALQLIKRLKENLRQQKQPLREYYIDCNGEDDLSGQDWLSAADIWKENQQPARSLYVFLECQNVLDVLSNLFSRLIESEAVLSKVSVLLTVTQQPAAPRSGSALFKFAKERELTHYWCADRNLVEEVLKSAGKIAPDFDDYCVPAFHLETGSADMSLVGEFLDSPATSLADWLQTRRDNSRISVVSLPAKVPEEAARQAEPVHAVPADGAVRVPAPEPEPGVPAEAPPPAPSVGSLAAGLRRLISSEVDYVNQISLRRSGKRLSALFVGRSFQGVSLPGNLAPADAQRWESVCANPGGFVLLGNAGFGKTLQLLFHELSVCSKLQKLMDSDPPEEAVELAFYTRAPEIAAELAKGKLSLIQAAVRCLQESGRLDAQMAAWTLEMFARGRGTLIVDALDEVSDDYQPAGLGSHRRILLDRLTAHLYTASPCAVIVGARKVGYSFDEAPPLPHWELLPFRDHQLDQAIGKWFPNPEWEREFRRAVLNVPPLEDTICIPVLLMLSAQMYQEAFQAGVQARGIDLTRRVEFYRRALNSYRNEWVRRMIEARRPPNQAQKDSFHALLEEVGWSLWSNSPNRSEFSGVEVNRAIDRCEIPGPFKQRDCYQDVCESGLLAGFQGYGARFEFLHRTLLEFLAAARLVRKAEEPGSAVDPWDEIQRRSNIADSSVPWMVAGLLKNPGSLLDAIRKRAIEDARKEPANAGRIEMTEPLVDCLSECRQGAVGRETLDFTWGLSARTLDTMQRQRGRWGDEWQNFVDWSLSNRILHAAWIHEGSPARTAQLRDVLQKLRRTQDGSKVESPAEFAQTIEDLMASPCAPVRWMAVWVVGALTLRNFGGHLWIRQEFPAFALRLLLPAFQSDPDPHVRAISGRAMIQCDCPGAFDLLVQRLQESSAEAASASAIALSACATREAADALKSRASRALSEPPGDARNIVLAAVTGALDAVITGMKLRTDTLQLGGILTGALQSPSSVARSSAASALGKLHLLAAWPILIALLEAPRASQLDAERGAYAFACQQLAQELSDAGERDRALRVFRRILEDREESQKARRPAASALGRLLQAEGSDKRTVLILQREAEDPAVSEACLFALTRANSPEAESSLMSLLREEVPIRSLFCHLVAKQPNGAGLRAVLWLLQNDMRLEIQHAGLYAIQRAAIQAGGRARIEGEFYGTNTDLLSRLAEACIGTIRAKHPEVVTSAVGALGALARLQTFTSSPALAQLLNSVLEPVRELAASESKEIQESTAFLLGAIGVKSDVALLLELRNKADDPETWGQLDSAAQFLQRRLGRMMRPGRFSRRT